MRPRRVRPSAAAILTGFDPATTPALLVEALRDVPPEDLLNRLVLSHRDLADAVRGLDDEDWSVPAEAPPGHVSIRTLVLHALWDAWIHERDMLLPLGIEPPVETDEVTGTLLYAAALGPAYLATTGSTRVGRLVVSATNPSVAFVVEVGPRVLVRLPRDAADESGVVLRGDAVRLAESLSCRSAPWDVPEEGRWMTEGLAGVFDLSR